MIAKSLQRVDQSVSGWSRNQVLGISILAALILGVVDYYAPPDLLVLYLAPIFLAAWYGGTRVGNVVAIYCAGATFVVQALIDQSLNWNPDALWSLLVRFITFLLVSRVVGRLRELMRQQQELTGFIVHDLRSPISSAITGLMTLEQANHNLGELEGEMVSLALVSNQRALNLVNSILDVSKLESGKMEVRAEKIRLATFVDETIAQLALWAKGNEVEIVRELDGADAVLDPSLTSRVLVNLLSNALKFSPAGSKVTLRAVANAHGVRFSVIDQGPGIPPEFVESIFEPFAQVKGTKGGTGLGLTFCRLAVLAQGGKIWVESQVGKGTMMIFTIPPGSTKATEASQAFVEQPEG
jgi:signal transduction histidine kinase